MTYCKPALASGLNGWNARECAAAVAARRQTLGAFLARRAETLLTSL